MHSCSTFFPFYLLSGEPFLGASGRMALAGREESMDRPTGRSTVYLSACLPAISREAYNNVGT